MFVMSSNTVEYVLNVVMEVLKWQDNLINLVCYVLVKVVNKFEFVVFPEVDATSPDRVNVDHVWSVFCLEWCRGVTADL